MALDGTAQTSGQVESGMDRGAESVSGELAVDEEKGQFQAPATPKSAEDGKKEILRERARKLAQRPETEVDLDTNSLPVTEFMLGEERYAIDMAFIREVYPLKDLTPVPCTPSFILGIINVRGQILSVTDVREFFDLPSKEITDSSKVIIVSNGSMELGIFADAVIGEAKILLDEIQTETPALQGIRAEYLWGITPERTAIFDIQRFLSDSRIIVHEEVNM